MDPTQLRYSPTHEWLYLKDLTATVGISRFAVDQLTDLINIELPAVGTRLVRGKSFGEIESVKAVSDLYAPMSGEVTEVNTAVVDNVQLLADDPYELGWRKKLIKRSAWILNTREICPDRTAIGVFPPLRNTHDMAYLANTPDDIRVMLRTIGLDSLDQLFDMVPPEFRLKRALDVGPALTELELTNHISGLLARNQGADQRVCFLGAGSYDHFIPAVVDHLASRGEFYTAYTPYQAEASQGTLQASFEYQTLVTQLTGMDVSNASLYDGGSAAAEAMLMALAITKRFGQIVVAETVHPEYRQVLATFLAHLEPNLVTIPGPRGTIDPATLAAALTDDTAAVVLQYPNVFGQLEDIEALVKTIHARGALAIVSVDPISLGLLRRPGEYGADIVVAEGQGLGNPMSFGDDD